VTRTEFWAPVTARYLHVTIAVARPLESKVAYLYITVAVGPIWKARYFAHYSCYWGPFKNVVSLLTH